MNEGAAAWRAGSEYDLKTAWVNFDGLMGDIRNDSDLGCVSLREDEPIPRVKARTIKLKSGMMDHYSQTLSCHTAWDWRYCDLYCSSVDCLGYVSVLTLTRQKHPYGNVFGNRPSVKPETDTRSRRESWWNLVAFLIITKSHRSVWISREG